MGKQSANEEAVRIINKWLTRALSSGIERSIKFVNTRAIHTCGMLNWYDHPVTSGRVERTHNKIEVFKRMAYGFRDMDFFKWRILDIHEAKYALAS